MHMLVLSHFGFTWLTKSNGRFTIYDSKSSLKLFNMYAKILFNWTEKVKLLYNLDESSNSTWIVSIGRISTLNKKLTIIQGFYSRYCATLNSWSFAVQSRYISCQGIVFVLG